MGFRADLHLLPAVENQLGACAALNRNAGIDFIDAVIFLSSWDPLRQAAGQRLAATIGMETQTGRVEAPPSRHRALAHLDLRGTDLRGADFAGADLRAVRTGLKPGSKALLVGMALLVSIGTGIVTGLGARYLMALIDSADPRRIALGLNAGAAVLVYLAAALWKGGHVAIRTVLPVVAAMFLSAAAIAIVTGLGTGAGAIAMLGFFLVGATVIALAAFARAVAGTGGNALFTVVAIAGGLAGGLVGGGIPAVIVAVSAMIAGRRAVGGSGTYSLLTRLTVTLACKRGTRFQDADLTGANLSGAKLTACDFRGATLDGARMDNAEIHMCLFDDDRPVPSPRHH